MNENTQLTIGMTYTTVCDSHLGQVVRECGELDVRFTEFIGIDSDGTDDPCRVCTGCLSVKAIANAAYDLQVIWACN